MEEQQRKRYHNMMLAQQIQYLKPPLDTLDKLLAKVGKIGAERYAGILHDKDIGEEDHIHLFMHFKNSRDIKAVAKALNIAPQYIESWDNGISNGFAYLIHRTKNAENDYQYAATEVTANFDYINWVEKFEAKHQRKNKIDSQRNEIEHLLDCLYVGILTREEVEKQLSGCEYAKTHKKIEDVWAKRLQNLAEERMKQRKVEGQQVEVIWIYGEAGTGKTRFAKEQAAKHDSAYFITGSTRDPFQRYSGEDVIIYDEARPRDIPFSDLLKLLDPYGEDVSAPSRYYDKAICAALYYITTPFSPLDFYQEIMGAGWETQKDGFDQLLRRLSLIIHMMTDRIEAVEYSSEQRNFLPLAGAQRENPYRKVPEEQEENKADKFNSLFSEDK